METIEISKNLVEEQRGFFPFSFLAHAPMQYNELMVYQCMCKICLGDIRRNESPSLKSGSYIVHRFRLIMNSLVMQLYHSSSLLLTPTFSPFTSTC